MLLDVVLGTGQEPILWLKKCHGIPDLKITSPFDLAITPRVERIATPVHHGLIWIVFSQCAQETLHSMTNLDPGGLTESDDMQGTGSAEKPSDR